jgi:hypothetical protein
MKKLFYAQIQKELCLAFWAGFTEGVSFCYNAHLFLQIIVITFATRVETMVVSVLD